MNRERAEEFDRGLDSNARVGATARFAPLIELAAELRMLPSLEFRERLRAELADHAEAINAQEDGDGQMMPTPASDIFPTLERRELTMLPADPRSFIFSFLSHAAAVVLIASGIWVSQKTVIKNRQIRPDVAYVMLPPGDNVPHGGGNGGDANAVPVSRGTPPKFSMEQLTPPAIVVQNPAPKLQVHPSVLGPPQLHLPESTQLGDLLAPNTTIPSNGTGAAGGMGNNRSLGVGTGDGPGAGPGSGGGCCTGPFRPGNGVFAPHAIYDPEPEYSEEARKAKYSGIVVLSIVVDPAGLARDIHIARSLGMGLDEKAIEAVRKWRFSPGMRDGVPVAVRVNVEVSFHLY